MMRQAWHILLKDTRQFRYPIAALFVWMVIFVAGSVSPWQTDAVRLAGFTEALGALSWFIYSTAWAVLIALVVHAESLPGDRQFWLTRPYRRSSLMTAKAMFVLIYMTLPLAVAQSAIVVLQGLSLSASLPGLLWNQLLIGVVVLLPAATAAVLTSTLPQFVVVSMLVPMLWFTSRLLPPWAAFEWVRSSVAISAIVAVTSVVLFVQFMRRRTTSARRIALVGVLAGMLILMWLPWQTAFAVQSHLADPWVGTVSASLDRRPRQSVHAGLSQALEMTGVGFRFGITGLPADTPITCDATQTVITGSDGRVWETALDFAGASASPDTVHGCFTSGPLPPAFRDRVADRIVNVKASLYVTVFGPEQQIAVPLDQSYVPVPGDGLCLGLGTRGPLIRNWWPQVICRWAFRSPPGLGSTRDGFLWRSRSYSPFPADLRLQPVLQREFRLRSLEALTISSRQPVAHVRIDVQESDVLLRDFAW